MRAVVVAKYRVWDIAVSDNLYGAVVVAQLLLGDYVRVVAMNVSVYAYYALHEARYCTYVVRYHGNSHILGEVVQYAVQFVLEAVVHKVCRLVKHQELGLRDYGTTEHNPL